MTTDVSTQVDGLVSQIISTSGNKNKMLSHLTELEEELKNTLVYKAIQLAKTDLSDLEKQEEELREQAKQQMLSADIKSITLLSGMTVQLNATPGALKIEDENLIPKEYIKTKEVTSIDKVKIKNDIKEGCIIEGCSIETDYKFVIKA